MDDYKEMLEENLAHLKDLAKDGDRFYEYEYGMALLTNDEYDEAIKYLESSSSKGYEDATYCLGLCYEQGICFDQDIEKAKEYYNELVKKNSGYGYKGLADLLFYGDTSNKEKMEALSLYEKGALKTMSNYYYCNYELGSIYRRGIFVKKDMTKAVEYFLIANEEMVEPEMTLTLGLAYLNGKYGLEKDLTKAHDLLLEFLFEVTDEETDLIEEFNKETKKCKDEDFLNKLYLDAKNRKDECDEDCECHHHHQG